MSSQMNFSVQVYNNKEDYEKKQSDSFGFIGSPWWSGRIFYKWTCT